MNRSSAICDGGVPCQFRRQEGGYGWCFQKGPQDICPLEKKEKKAGEA